jgi:Zn-dependent M28 family amino/carboxypeptidase
MTMLKQRYFLLFILGVSLVLFLIVADWRPVEVSNNITFDETSAMAHVVEQASMGPRTPGSPGHDRVKEYILSELSAAGWSAEVASAQYLGQKVENIIAKRHPDSPPGMIIGAHYDTRFTADRDPDPGKRTLPVPGANDGASGVAVLLELARVLDEKSSDQVWLVFFDAEDNGKVPGWEWIMGSSVFVNNLEQMPKAAVIVDMVGDADLNIYYEKQSDTLLSGQIWEQAAELGYDKQFVPMPKHSILDDHIPFIRMGIPAVDIIDIDYPYWHTTEDTVDKISPASLGAVGLTLEAWLEKQLPLAK